MYMKRLYIMKQKRVVITYSKQASSLSIHYFLDYSFPETWYDYEHSNGGVQDCLTSLQVRGVYMYIINLHILVSESTVVLSV